MSASADMFAAMMEALGASDLNDTPPMAAVCDAYRATRITDTALGATKPANGNQTRWPSS
jgi:hypothetical protein